MVLWVVIALFLALSVAWEVYPRALGFHHPDPFVIRHGEWSLEKPN
jgi:hypothetical protein